MVEILNKYDEFIMRNIRERMCLEPFDKSKDAEIMKLTKRQAFKEWLEWEGLVGFSDYILEAVEEIFGVDIPIDEDFE